MDTEEGASESNSLSTGVEDTPVFSNEKETENQVESENQVEPEPEKQVEPEPEKKSDLDRKDTTENAKKVVKSSKIEVRLQAAGDAPIMKQKNYKVDGDKQISWILSFIRKFLKLKPTDALFLYVNQAFAPSPDQTVSNLSQCFGQDNKLVLYYSRSQAWG